MTDEARNLINSPFGLRFAYAVGKYTSDWMGHRIAISIADFISARKNWKFVQTTRSNQWVVNGENLDSQTLDKLVAKNIRNIAISIFDYYHNVANPAASLRAIEVHPFALQLVHRPEFDERGLILAGLHLSNFNMIFEMSGLAGVKALAMTLPEFNAAYQKQWEMHKRSGLQFVNASIGSMKHAINYLRQGGMVVTAIDRPDPSSTYRPNFFGHPSVMPIHHIFLALKAQVPVVLAAIIKKPDGMYRFLFSDPIEMIPSPDRHAEIIINAENVLNTAEDFIRHDPTQWSMTFPIWPDITPQTKDAVR